MVRLRLVIGRRWVVRGWSGMDGMMSQRSGMNGMGDGGSMDGMVGDRSSVNQRSGMDGMRDRSSMDGMSQRSGMNGMSEWGSMDGMRDRSGMDGMVRDWESVVRGVVTRGHDHSPVADGGVVSDVSQDSRHEGAQGGCYLQ